MIKEYNKSNYLSPKFKKVLKENFTLIYKAFFLALLLRILFAEAYKIPSGSMVPNLLIGDYIIVNKFIFGMEIPILEWKTAGLRNPKRGEIIVFKYPKHKSPGKFLEFLDLITLGFSGFSNSSENPKYFIKRLVAIPGDFIKINEKGMLLINNQALEKNSLLSESFLEKTKKIYPSMVLNIENTLIENQEPYYKYRDKNTVLSFDEKFQLYTQKIDENVFMIQKINPQFLANQEAYPLLYVPKKGDLIEFELSNTLEIANNKMISIHINQTPWIKIPIQDFFQENPGRPSSFYYENFYNEALFNDDSQSTIFQDSMSFKKFLLKEKKFQYQFKLNHFFVMGDNRDNSWDSKNWGFVNSRNIMGKPMVLYYPFSRLRTF